MLESLIPSILSGIVLLKVSFLWDKKPNNLSEEEIVKHNKFRPLLAILAIVFIPFIGAKFISLTLLSSFDQAGLRSNNVSLILDEDNYKIVHEVSHQLTKPIENCSGKVKKKNIIHNVNVLWHGIGERSLIEFPKSNITVELDRKGLYLLTDKNQIKTDSCLSLNAVILFNTNKSEPNEFGKQELEELISTSKKYIENNLTIHSISIFGFADTIPTNKTNTMYASNLSLSKERADGIYNLIQNKLKNPSIKDSRVIGKGSTQSQKKCPDIKNFNRLNECLMINRRVEVMLNFKRKANKN